jgi:DNA-binding CsgD family transcriptional regulator/tetratricopeptide (TPR) repeat protein
MFDVPRLGSGIPLVARRRELATLRTALWRAEQGTAGAVLISGDAGVGKSRLLDELISEASGGTGDGSAGNGGAGNGSAGDAAARERPLVLTGRCLDTGETGLPYLAFAEALGRLGGDELDALLARPALGRLLPGLRLPAPARTGPSPVAPLPAPGPQPERDVGELQLFEAVLGLLAELTERHTVLLAIEDLHWADSSSRNLLSLLVSRLRAQRLLLVATYRSDDLHRRHPLRQTLAELLRLPAVERLELAPLDAAESRELVAALAELPMPDELVARMAERSEGNPFFAEELVAACGDATDAMPAALADLLLSRVERLSPPAQQVVRLASVAGRRVAHPRLAAVAEAEPGLAAQLDDALREAITRHVLLVDGEEGVYQFRHALLREAVYGDLLPGERVRLHNRYATEIATGPPGRGRAAELAYHSLESNALAAALAASVDAAEEAGALGAPAAALRHVEQALKLWDAVPADERPPGVPESELLRNASYLAGTSGEPERAISYARASVAQADASGDPEPAAKSRRRLIKALTAFDVRGNEVIELAEQAWRLVAGSPPSPLRTWTLATRAAILRMHDRAEARTSAEQAIAESGLLGEPGPETTQPDGSVLAAVADAMTTLGLLADRQRDQEAARRHLSEAISTAGRSDSPNTELRARYFLGLHYYEHGLLERAVQTFDEGLERAREQGLSWSTFGLELRVLRVIAKYTCGDWAGSAEGSLPPGRRVSGTVVARIAAAGVHLAVARGEFDDAEKTLADLRDMWQVDEQIALFAGWCGIELELWRGAPELAARRADELREWLMRRENSMLVGLIRIGALALAAQRELARTGSAWPGAADEWLAEVRRIAAEVVPRTGELGPEGKAWFALAVAMHGAAAGTDDPAAWQAAVDGFDYGDPYRAAIARWHQAEALHAAGDRTVAGARLLEAYRVATELSALPLAEAIQGFATRARFELPGGRRTAGADPLTPRERSVLELVAAGRTNREVGAELFISEKTVSVHLNRVMAKLGASRRAEAVAAAYASGIIGS